VVDIRCAAGAIENETGLSKPPLVAETDDAPLSAYIIANP